jgi:protein ImuB
MSTLTRRYLSVWLRRLPTDRIESRKSTPAEPLVVATQVKGALRLSAVNDLAAAKGLKVGMALADVRAMYPKISVVDADEEADRALLVAIADWCDHYTPLVGLDPPDGLLLDVTGCAHLFGGEAALARDLVRRLTSRGIQARIAVTGTVGCAWAVARFGEAGPVAVTASGNERNTIASFSLVALRLTSGIFESLAQVGLKHIADVLDRPRAPLAARFGAILVQRIDQALGQEDEPIAPRLPVPAALVEQRFADPIALERDVLGTIEKLGARLCALLTQRGEGARLLQVALFRADGKVFRIETGTAEPLRDPARIAKLFVERLDMIGDEIDPGFGYDMVRLAALVTERSDPQQTGLAAPDYEADLAHLIDRFGARFGLRRVTRLHPQDTHIPEFAVMAVSAHMANEFILAGPGRSAARTGALQTRNPGGFREPEQDSLFPTRPVRLLERPELIDAIAELPDGPPAQFTWRHMRHTVVRAEGPERIAMQWWRNEVGKTLMRDYFRIESQDGLRVWIYRAWPNPHKLRDEERKPDQAEEWYLGQKFDQQKIHWFLHGLFS